MTKSKNPKVECTKWELMALEELVPHPRNDNQHKPEHAELLAKVMKARGIRHPIITSKKSGFIVAGHLRLMAAKILGLEKYPVEVQNFKNEAEEYAFLSSDNNVARYAELDESKMISNLKDLEIDVQNLDFSELGLLDFEFPPEEAMEYHSDEDSVPEVKEEPITKKGDIWILGNHRLMCGDSTMIDDVEKLMDGQKADVWIADPPFGVSYCDKNAAVNGGVVKNQTGKEIKSDTKTVEELCPFWRDVSLNAYAVTTMEASNYWCACQGSDKMMMMMMMDEAGWNIRHELIWVKDSFVFGRSDYHYQHEPIIYGWKKKGKHNWYSDRKQSSVFRIDRPKRSDLHPTTKPVELFEQFIKNSSPKKGIIFESFGGSGTTLIASEKLGRVSMSMELDENYCDVIIERWQNFTKKDAVLESNNKTYNELRNG